MGSERPTIFNPKENNRSLLVTTILSTGRELKLALLKPGQSYRPDRASWSVREVHTPAKLNAELRDDGTYYAF